MKISKFCFKNSNYLIVACVLGLCLELTLSNNMAQQATRLGDASKNFTLHHTPGFIKHNFPARWREILQAILCARISFLPVRERREKIQFNLLQNISSALGMLSSGKHNFQVILETVANTKSVSCMLWLELAMCTMPSFGLIGRLQLARVLRRE